MTKEPCCEECVTGHYLKDMCTNHGCPCHKVEHKEVCDCTCHDYGMMGACRGCQDRISHQVDTPPKEAKPQRCEKCLYSLDACVCGTSEKPQPSEWENGLSDVLHENGVDLPRENSIKSFITKAIQSARKDEAIEQQKIWAKTCEEREREARKEELEPPMPNTIEELVDKIMKSKPMRRVLSIEVAAMVTGRANEYEDVILPDVLRQALLSLQSSTLDRAIEVIRAYPLQSWSGEEEVEQEIENIAKRVEALKEV